MNRPEQQAEFATSQKSPAAQLVPLEQLVKQAVGPQM
jgi:hypothetical protein